MKIAVVAVTKQGIKLAEETVALLSQDPKHETVLYVPGKFSLLQIDGNRQLYRKPLKELFGELFTKYDGIVCIMALGIVVRLAAPYLKSKLTDPAVVVMDELGTNVISTLSGHWGGANALTMKIAKGLGANPVITTATDVRGLPALEMLAQEHGWTVEPWNMVKTINAAIVNQQKIIIFSEKAFDLEQSEHIEIKDFTQYSPARKEEGRVVLITNRSAASFPEGTVFLRPRNLVIGIGCRKGVSVDEVKAAIIAALETAGRAITSVRCLSSIDIKSEEQGLLQAAQEFNLPVQFYSGEEILKLQQEKQNELSFSKFVDEKIGVGGVCEPVALIAAGQRAKLIMPKTKYSKVAVAIAEADWQ